MQLVASLVSVLLLVWSVRASALPGEERAAVASSREQTKARKDLILKMLVGLLDGMDTGREAIPLTLKSPRKANWKMKDRLWGG